MAQEKHLSLDIPVSELQKKILLSDKEIVVVSAGRGTGKTAITSLIAVFALLRGERVIVVAPTRDDAKKANFYQIKEFLNKIKINPTYNNSELTIELKGGKIFIFSGEAPSRLRGPTSISKIIFDEAALLPEEIWTNAIPTARDLKGRKKHFYVVSTPPANEEHWMAKLAKQDDVALFLGNARDNPFVEKEFLDSLENLYKMYPENFIRRELYGEMIFSNTGDSLFEDFEIEISENQSPSDFPKVLGLDIAGPGRDMTCGVITQKNRVLGIEMRKTNNETELKNFVQFLHNKYRFNVIRYDSTGIGVLLQFNIPSIEISPCNFGASGGERFNKLRAAIYFKTKSWKKVEMSQNLYKEHGRELKSELRATRIKEKDSAKIGLIEKDEIRRMIGRSPDRADALALALSYREIKQTKPRIAPLVFGRR